MSTLPHLNFDAIDQMLETETNKNKTDSWNKLNKTVKIQKLHGYAEKYGREEGLPVKEVRLLKTFFVECLGKSKLLKTKEVIYDRDAHEITSVPALFFNAEKKNFTLRNMDSKRVSTMKSLTPKRVIVTTEEGDEAALP